MQAPEPTTAASRSWPRSTISPVSRRSPLGGSRRPLVGLVRPTPQRVTAAAPVLEAVLESFELCEEDRDVRLLGLAPRRRRHRRDLCRHGVEQRLLEVDELVVDGDPALSLLERARGGIFSGN